MNLSVLLFLGGLGLLEILLIVLVVLLLFGGKKIPELMKGIGKGVRSFKDGVNGVEDKKEDDNKRMAKIYLFMDTSKAYPLFDDPDTEVTDSYIIEGNELTPFSLNTDWQKAYGNVKVELEKEK